MSRVAFEDWGGDGPPVLLVHGAGDDHTIWRRVAKRITPTHRVAAIDLPGHGTSASPERWDWALAVEYVEEAADALGMANPFVVGHSLGGMVAVRYGVAHPDSPGVMNIDGHGIGGPSAPKEFHDQRELLVAELPKMAGILATLPDDTGRDLWALYPVIECPLLIVHCTRIDDGPIPRALMATYRQALAGDLKTLSAEVVTLDAGHYVHVEDPDTVVDLVRRFTA